jgi:hypothetical protein
MTNEMCWMNVPLSAASGRSRADICGGALYRSTSGKTEQQRRRQTVVRSAASLLVHLPSRQLTTARPFAARPFCTRQLYSAFVAGHWSSLAPLLPRWSRAARGLVSSAKTKRWQHAPPFEDKVFIYCLSMTSLSSLLSWGVKQTVISVDAMKDWKADNSRSLNASSQHTFQPDILRSTMSLDKSVSQIYQGIGCSDWIANSGVNKSRLSSRIWQPTAPWARATGACDNCPQQSGTVNTFKMERRRWPRW